MIERGLRLSAFAASDRGRVREANEDSFYAGDTVFAVADGMGGHVAGEVASRKALEPIADLDGREFPTSGATQDALVEAITAANTAVVEKGDAEPELQGMGTTLTAVVVRAGSLHLAHVGDSRAYLLRAGEAISQLTTDHTLVEQLVREGRLSREQAATHPQRSVITRAIGVERQVKVDSLPPIELQPGDQVLLCSDGLTGPVSDEEIADLLVGNRDGEGATRALVAAANDAGGPDNVTVVLLRVAGGAHGTNDGMVPAGTAATAPAEPFVPAAPARSGPTKQIRTRDEGVSTDDWAERMGRLGQRQGAEGTGLGRRQRRRSGVGRTAAIVLGVLLLLGMLGGGGYGLLSRAYFVGDLGGRVAIYNGIPQTLAGLPLHWVREETDLAVADLPAFRAERIREGLPATSLTEAREIVERHREFADSDNGEDTGTGTTSTPAETSTPSPPPDQERPAPGADPSP